MIRLEDIIRQLEAFLPEEDIDLVRKAYVYSAKVHRGQVRLSGEPYLSHPLEVAGILASLRLDATCVAAGLLHDTVEDTLAHLEDIRRLFGDTMADLVDGVTKISRLEATSWQERQADSFRKMLMAMSRDPRVIFVKLADRLHNMRTLQYQPPEKRQAIARETMDIYAPLANRLGMGWVKEDLEETAFRHLRPEEYEDIHRRLTAGQKDRQAHLEEVTQILEAEIQKSSLRTRIMGRTKSIHSIHKKLAAQNITLDQVNDLTALRIITDSVRDCYAVLGIIHSLWKPVPGRFKDFIALPKANMYRSLHTTVIGPGGPRVEFQIRTEEMHRVAEVGVAAHWRYKEGRPLEAKDDERFNWLRQLLEWQREVQDPREYLRNLRIDLFPEEVYVFTPKGEVVELPRDATPVDFAYFIHTDVGNHCVGAKVNGKIAPLKQALHNGDTVEILTSPHRKPSRDWLKFVQTGRARSKIRAFLRLEEKERSLDLGREILEKELARYGQSAEGGFLKDKKLEAAAQELDLPSARDLIQAVGFGRLSPRQVLVKLLPPEVIQAQAKEGVRPPAQEAPAPGSPARTGGVKVKNIEDMLIRFAGCCNPVPGDPIVGFITRGRGVTIHSADCPNIHVLDIEPERRIEVEWEAGAEGQHTVEIHLETVDEPGILAKISGVIAENNANIGHLQADTDTGEGGAIIQVAVQIRDLSHLDRVLHGLRGVKGVLKVERVRGISVRP
ncbi:MAG: bifunctional (p)ppGpp synthetase/guanosine-3',5'-bis(diphosphate) 3'-pyrophosphohydrolase [Candidatus Tectomicrobia bacterium]|nr:bifunctional (p)ppGpp synthetase/guanosine-3',5'-bis(diphosphate) 3'-pyrophosphohydrolase [Candidatus Tectomicrobia bacterium]